MHLFFNDPRVAYVTRHRRVVRHPLLALVAGGVGVAALGVAIGAAGWEPPQQGKPAPQPAQQQGMAMPDPVQDVNLYGVPAAPQPVLDLGTPPRTLAAPARPRPPAKTAKAKVKRVEKERLPTTRPPATQEPTHEPTHEPTPEPTPQPTLEPTQEPTTTQEPTAWHPGWPQRHWPWEQHEQQEQRRDETPTTAAGEVVP